MTEHNLEISTSGIWVKGSCSCGGFNQSLVTATKRRNNAKLEQKIRRRHRAHVEFVTLPIQARVRRIRDRRIRRGKSRS